MKYKRLHSNNKLRIGDYVTIKGTKASKRTTPIPKDPYYAQGYWVQLTSESPWIGSPIRNHDWAVLREVK